tara:strand:- start:418 stop:549 length:132 start_codon:yes stop_codon:yes gene_type:complete
MGTGCHSNGGFDCNPTKCENGGMKFLTKNKKRLKNVRSIGEEE